jgi:pheromone shutdown-related protein TraB
MDKYSNLYLIGSSHISKQSIKEIKKAFEDLKPDLVAVELDKQRLHGLMSDKKSKFSLYDIKRVGLKGFLFALIGSWASNKLGKLVGVKPGTEMKTAIKLAKKNKVKVALIDQNIEVTLKKFSKAFTWKEKFRVISDIFQALVLRKKDKVLTFDLNKVPSRKIINMLIAQVKERYPNLHKVIIEERNYYMARKLKKLMALHPDEKILVVMGAGHLDEVIRILKDNEGISYSYSYNVSN